MTAFVPGFQNDIFISYASVDNEPLIPGKPETKWVTTLRQMLKTRIEQRLGRRDSAQIWMDLQGLQGNSDFSEEIQAAIRSSAILLCVVTEGYLVSEWCRRELELFAEAHEGNTTGRIFMIRRDDIPYNDERWPEPFRTQTGYPFFIKDPETGQVLTMGQPLPDPDQKEYFRQVDRVRTDIATKLKDLASGGGSGAAGVLLAPAAAPSGSGGPCETATPSERAAEVIYLGETTPDLYEHREKVKRHLEQRGYEVLPSGLHSRVPDEFKREVRADLEKAGAFVRLFGPYCSASIPGMLEGGYEGVEEEIARSLEKPVVSWRSRDVTEVPDSQHRERVFGPEVVAMALEEFKGFLVESLQSLRARESVTSSASGGERYVLLRSDPGDVELADSIAKILGEYDIGYDIIEEDVCLRDITDTDDYDGLMVLYGNSTPDWVRDRVRECRQVALKKKNKAPACAVYIGPPDPKPPLRTKPPKFDVIPESATDLLEQYIKRLTSADRPA